MTTKGGEGSQVGFYPFWFWNDRLTEDEIRWQVGQMAAQGVRGFFLHSRQGLQQPYLADAFFEMVDVALEAAETQGLRPHLYDEYPYPSGVAGGEVVLGNPQFMATRLIQEQFDVKGGLVRQPLPAGKVLFCRAYPVDGAGTVDWEGEFELGDAVGPVLVEESYIDPSHGLYYNTKRYFASEPTPVLETTLPPGRYRIYAAVQAPVRYHKYWDHYVDVLNPDAVARYVELTHERYAARYGAELGARFGSIFMDETSPHWSERLPEEFQARAGYDLLDMLPALTDADHPRHRQVAHDFWAVSYALFCEAFMAPISTWCRAHGLAYSGETDWVRFSQLRYMDIPGGDPGHSKVGAPPDYLGESLRKNARAVASAAYLYGDGRSLCECYHSMGWGATLQDAKWLAEGLLLMGITHLVPHGFFYSTHGLRKHDAPPSFFFQMPYWRFWGQLSARVDAIGQAFADTHIDAQILVVDPHSGLPTRGQRRTYEALLHWLMGRHLDFLVVDTDVLVEGEMREGRLKLADVTAELILVPPMQVIEEPLAAWLASYAEAGGVVIYLEAQPDWEALAGEVGSRVQPHLSIRNGLDEAEQVWVVTRQGPAGRRWLLLNMVGKPIEVDLNAGTPLREQPLSEGDVPELLATAAGYRRILRPFESALLVAKENAAGEETPALPVVHLSLGGEWDMEPLDPNLLRMYNWELALGRGDGTYGPGRLVSAVPLANQLAAGRFRFQPQIKRYFGHSPELDWRPLDLRYTYCFVANLEGQVALVIEPDSLVGEWTLWVNRGSEITAGDLEPSDVLVRGTYKVDITKWLQPGENALEIVVKGVGPEGGLRNPLYLAGDFAVELDNPPRLMPRPSQGAFGDLEGVGLPTYAGRIAYRGALTLDAHPPGEAVLLRLSMPQVCHDALTIAINDGPVLPLLWEPRQVRYPTAALQVGENRVEIRLYTTLIRAFEGAIFDEAAHEYRPIAD